MNRCNGTEDCK